MSLSDCDTREILRRWCAGDQVARDALVERHLPWITARVAGLLGPRLLAAEEPADYVQRALVEFLRYSPRFEVESTAQLRAILLRIVENTIRDRGDWYRAARRRLSREQPLPSDTVLHLGRDQAFTPPDERAERNEMEGMLRLALELLDPERRRLIVMREVDGLTYAEVARELGVAEEAAKKRCQRAVRAVGELVDRLRRGKYT